MLKDSPSGISVDTESMGSELHTWLIKLTGPESTLYAGEDFILQFKFSNKYPFDSPEVSPLHHLYCPN